MSRVERGFIPLPKVESGGTSDKVFIKLNLPQFVDQDRIGVHIGRIEKLQKLSGIGVVMVGGTVDEDTSSENHNIVGVGPDGSALASKSKSKTIVPVSERSSIDNQSGMMARRNVALMLKINNNELTARIDMAKNPVRSPQPWIKEIDNTVRKGIRQVGTKNLIVPGSYDRTILLMDSGFTAGLVSIDLVLHTMSFITFLTVIWAGDKIGSRFQKKWWAERGEDYRISTLPSWFPALDRAAALQLLTRTQKLVADLHPEKK